ncbi:peptidoglycan-binding protein [Alkaliphilus metalliredigens]|nr:peptidoglycan-binding protein [Alkaliphilus metalliredigens]
MKKRIISILLILILLGVNVTAYAHSGRTDSSGGHRDNKNASGLGSYHYHCGGHPAHLHKNGVCPYKTTKSTATGTSTTKSTSMTIQSKLNSLGYDCGVVDGIMGLKTKAAIKAFQKDNDLTVDGIVGPQTRKALEI